MNPKAKAKDGLDTLKGEEDVMDYPEISKSARRVVWCRKPELLAMSGKARKDAKHGTIEGYAAVWDNVDDQNEIIRRGSFTKSIEERVKVGDIKLMVKHFRDGGDVPDLIGTVVEAREDSHGLWFRAKLSKIKLAQDTRTLVGEGHVTGASVGFLPIKWNFMALDGKNVVELLENKLLEITITSRPANMLARVTAKTFLEGGKDAPSTVDEILAVPESYISSLSLDDSSRLAAEKERAVALGKAMEAQLSRLRKLTVEPEAPPVLMTDDRFHSLQLSLRRAKLDVERLTLVG